MAIEDGDPGPAAPGACLTVAMADDDLADFEETTFTFGGKTRTTYRTGTGPAVIVMAEIPGITPKVAGFARKVADIGCTAVMPHLFGEPGRDPSAAGRGASMVSMAKTIGPLCVSREFTMWAANRTSPVVEWLRALADHEHEVCGGPGVGAIGMCFTGGYALAMRLCAALLALGGLIAWLTISADVLAEDPS